MRQVLWYFYLTSCLVYHTELRAENRKTNENTTTKNSEIRLPNPAPKNKESNPALETLKTIEALETKKKSESKNAIKSIPPTMDDLEPTKNFGGSADIQLRQAYFYETSTIKSNWYQWAQAFELNFSSGYLADILGLDFSSYHSAKLARKKPSSLNSHADDDELFSESGSYNKIGQLFAKIKLGNEINYSELRTGWMLEDTEFVSSSTSRATPSTFQGWDVRFNTFNFKLYALLIDKLSKRTEQDFQPLVNHYGQKIDSIFAIGSTVDFYGAKLMAEYTESTNYVKHAFAGLEYGFAFSDDINVLINLRYYNAQKNGVLWTGGFIEKAQLNNGNIILNILNLDIGISFSKVRAPGGGIYDYTNSANDYGNGGYWTKRHISDFNYNTEVTQQLSLEYHFITNSELDMFTKITATSGKLYTAPAPFVHEVELDLVAGVQFTNGPLQGLTTFIDNGSHTRFIEGKSSHSIVNNLRIYSNYTLTVF